MGRYCRKIDGKYFAVLAHACNGWQEHKYEADDDERMKGWSSWPSSTWSRFEIAIDLGAARVAASTTSHPSLLTALPIAASHPSLHTARCSLRPLHSARSITLLTELDTTRANSCPPSSYIWRVNLHRLLTTLLKASLFSELDMSCKTTFIAWVMNCSVKWTKHYLPPQ